MYVGLEGRDFGGRLLNSIKENLHHVFFRSKETERKAELDKTFMNSDNKQTKRNTQL